MYFNQSNPTLFNTYHFFIPLFIPSCIFRYSHCESMCAMATSFPTNNVLLEKSTIPDSCNLSAPSSTGSLSVLGRVCDMSQLKLKITQSLIICIRTVGESLINHNLL